MVGVPLTIPDAEFKVSPGGRLPEIMENTFVGLGPPLTGKVAV
jgi:hypothetical protein